MYLKRFADHKQRIVMVSRDQKKRLPGQHIREVCAQTDYYTVETGNGPSQEVEKLLSRIEGEANTAIERMINGEFPPSATDREAVALFIGYQCLRGDESRQMVEQLSDTMYKFVMSHMTGESLIENFRKREGREPTKAEIDAQSFILNNPDAFTVKPHQNEIVRGMLEIAPEVASIMLRRRWFLGDHGEPCLLTSDTPVVSWSERTSADAHYGRGWGNADEIRMPLSPRHSLCLVWNEEFKERMIPFGRKLGPEIAAGMNQLVAHRARRWIFHHPDTDPLKGITLSPVDPVLTVG
ncbi:DUF4238 domain-containing protein [Corallococcus exercitus]|uniref:DUF4238 domain-containing protein n=2 Tax=Corallococcus exercitus TaxID=2316736 RepID=A0A7Y4KNE3_9BACT|nr:DUF4238 domain-containing protein [Corallococcus exercitus]